MNITPISINFYNLITMLMFFPCLILYSESYTTGLGKMAHTLTPVLPTQIAQAEASLQSYISESLKWVDIEHSRLVIAIQRKPV